MKLQDNIELVSVFYPKDKFSGNFFVRRAREKLDHQEYEPVTICDYKYLNRDTIKALTKEIPECTLIVFPSIIEQKDGKQCVAVYEITSYGWSPGHIPLTWLFSGHTLVAAKKS